MATNPRVPLYLPPANRGEVSSSDAKIVNGYVEQIPGGFAAVKRPGFTVATGVGPTAGGTPRGGYLSLNTITPVNNFYWIVGTSFYQTTTSAGTVDGNGTYSFSETNNSVFFHNANHSYSWNFLTSTFTSLAAAPTGLVKGAAYLDGTTYVMDQSGVIHGSGINDLTTWNAANVIQAQIRTGVGVALFKQLQYVVALKAASTEVFFDNGNPTGSPLASAPSFFIPYGCVDSGSLQVLEDSALWLTNGTSGVAVMLLQNMQAHIVSTPAVEKLLQNLSLASGTTSWTTRVYGHRFYGLTVVASNLTLVYDLSTDSWAIWTAGTGGAFLPVNSVNGSFYPVGGTAPNWPSTYFQGSDGITYTMSGHEYDDNGTPFTFEVVTPRWDGGTRARKYNSRLDIIADQAATGALKVRSSDDDYQTWSNFRTVSLNSNRPALYNNGTFRKRAWHVTYTAPTPLRLYSLELTLLEGSV